MIEKEIFVSTWNRQKILNIYHHNKKTIQKCIYNKIKFTSKDIFERLRNREKINHITTRSFSFYFCANRALKFVQTEPIKQLT